MTDRTTTRGRPRLITHDGITDTRAGWSRRLGITPSALTMRLRTWPIEKALSMPREGGPMRGKPGGGMALHARVGSPPRVIALTLTDADVELIHAIAAVRKCSYADVVHDALVALTEGGAVPQQ